jgi:archaellum biogenesis ATPase FlaH
VLNGIKAKIVAPKLSHNSAGEALIKSLCSLNSDISHTVSEAALARERYLASVDERATTLCFLELQEMGLDLRKQI